MLINLYDLFVMIPLWMERLLSERRQTARQGQKVGEHQPEDPLLETEEPPATASQENLSRSGRKRARQAEDAGEPGPEASLVTEG